MKFDNIPDLLYYLEQNYQQNNIKILGKDTVSIGEVTITRFPFFATNSNTSENDEHYSVNAGTFKYEISPTNTYITSDNDENYRDMGYSESDSAYIYMKIWSLQLCSRLKDHKKPSIQQKIADVAIQIILLIIIYGGIFCIHKVVNTEEQNEPTANNEKVIDTTKATKPNTTILYREAIFPAVRNGR